MRAYCVLYASSRFWSIGDILDRSPRERRESHRPTIAPSAPAMTVLSRAVGRARWSIFWERLWPALASVATVIGLFLARLMARSLALVAADRAGGRSRRVLPAHGRGVRATPHVAGAEHAWRGCGGSTAIPAVPHRPATAMADEIAMPNARPRGGLVARSCGARVACGQDAARPGPRRRGWRCAIRSRCGHSWRCWWWRPSLPPATTACRRDRGGVRLAGRDDAGQFPHRRLGEPADLYRQAADDPAGAAAGRAGQHRGRHCGAGRQHAGDPRERSAGSMWSTSGGPRGGRNRRAQCRAAPKAPRSAASSSTRQAPPPCAASVERRDAGSSPPSPTSRRPSRSPRTPKAQARGAMLLTYKVEDDYGVIGAQATFTLQPGRGHQRAIRRARSTRRPMSHWCCRRRAPAMAPGRQPRI